MEGPPGDGDEPIPNGGLPESAFRETVRSRLGELEMEVALVSSKQDQLLTEVEKAASKDDIEEVLTVIEDQQEIVEQHHFWYRAAKIGGSVTGFILGSSALAWLLNNMVV